MRKGDEICRERACVLKGAQRAESRSHRSRMYGRPWLRFVGAVRKKKTWDRGSRVGEAVRRGNIVVGSSQVYDGHLIIGISLTSSSINLRNWRASLVYIDIERDYVGPVYLS